MFLVVSFAVFTVIALFLYFRYSASYQQYQVLKKHGIKTPPSSFFYGSYTERRTGVGFLEYLKKLHLEYGPIVGFNVGKKLRISVVDIELIKLITVKDFDYFMDRPFLPLGLQPKGVFWARGETWKMQRQILSPTFSSFKLKAVTPLIQQSVQSLVDVFQNYAGKNKTAEIDSLYHSFTMETILASAFGRVIEMQKGESNQLTEAAAAFYNIGEKKKSDIFLMTILRNLSCLKPLLKLLLKTNRRARAFRVMKEAAAAVVQERRMLKSKHQDLLQLMIDASVEDGESGKRQTLDDRSIVGNAMSFMLAAYDTTANTLSFTSYLLALHPHVQEKLQQEIDEYYEKNPDVTPYQAAQDLEYLDMVLQEALRLYPPAPMFSRFCNKDYVYKDITIPQGSVVIIPTFLLHMDQEYWKDPEEFDPMRFTAEEKAKRPQLVHMPFGHGPRRCIGIRLAHLEAKMALIAVLRRFNFVRTPETEVPLQKKFGITMSPKNGIFLDIVDRTSANEDHSKPIVEV